MPRCSRSDDCRSLDARSEESLSRSPSQVAALRNIFPGKSESLKLCQTQVSEPVATLRHLSPAPPSGQLSPSDSSCIIYEQLPAHNNVVPQTVTVQINYTPQPSGDGEFMGRVSEAQMDDDEASPPTRSTPHSPPSSPLIPKRTTSIFQRFQAALTRGDTFKSYISEFPPDQEAMISPSEEEKVEKRELPPRPSTTPLRTRSIFYNSVLSDRSTPSLPSLSHSYETLNGSDTAAENYRTPHRPAPAPPGESMCHNHQVPISNHRKKV